MNDHLKDKLTLFKEKMKIGGLPPVVIDTFAHYYGQVASGESGLICNADIAPILPEEIASFEDLNPFIEKGKTVERKAIMIRLNGGLGTSMGLTGPKSLLPIKDDHSFLGIILGQVEYQGVKLALMNSFSTHEETIAALNAIGPKQNPLLFIQNKFPKIRQDTLTPVTWPADPSLEWNPPGHGDIFTALSASGMLKNLLDHGIKYAFIANSDNLGATLDAGLLGYFSEKNFPFMMEVAEKTPSDIKGGHIARRFDGRLVLRESAQCPENEIDAFKDIRQYRYFNTNNIWVDLEKIGALIQKEGAIHLPIIINPKTVAPRDDTSPPVYQIETAMGAAISLFEDATAVRVPRSRFMPIKKCSDLLAVRSDCFLLNHDFTLHSNPNRKRPPIQIGLDNRYYQKIDDFDARFAVGIPSLIECESLSIEGDVAFEAQVTIKGRVTIKNPAISQMIVQAGTIIDNRQIDNQQIDNQ